jgi:hypothetical protein
VRRIVSSPARHFRRALSFVKQVNQHRSNSFAATGTARLATSQSRKIMLNKFAIDYLAFPHHHRGRSFTHLTDDPIEVEDFLMHLLAARARITAIQHDGAAMTGPQFDRMLKVAAERIASELLRESLALDAAEIKNRFGFAA